ncbi:MAG: hypothetical protein CMJ21_06905 [Phycisphaerae bacterium]|jgi:two-component system response regulator RegA|nr:hypothetical protein [Phycisphaerae bacterium]MDP6153291.1 response regulator [Phycisphaeraceae bacterium]
MDRTYTILLVAGNAMIVRGFEHFIRALGHETRGAATSSQAQALVADIQPACILLDMHLDEGGLPGLQVIPRLHRKAPNAVIVAMSADASWNLAADALQAGAFVFWRKYAAMTELVHVLDVSLTEHKHRTAGGHVVPLDELEREAILERMSANQGNVSQTARELGKTRDEMRRLMKRHHTLVTCAAAVDRHHRPDAASSTTAETLRLRPPTSP